MSIDKIVFDDVDIFPVASVNPAENSKEHDSHYKSFSYFFHKGKEKKHFDVPKKPVYLTRLFYLPILEDSNVKAVEEMSKRDAARKAYLL